MKTTPMKTKLISTLAVGGLLAAGAVATTVAATSANAAPNFQMPFPCGQTWDGSTRSNHSPNRSVDFNRPNDIGDTVVASASGTVSRVANEGSTSYGRWVEVNHGSGYTTRYAHLSTQSVSPGQAVKAGQKLGTVGSTGGSTGPHLHFEERLNGSAVTARFNGVAATYYTTKAYTSKNCGGGSTTPSNPQTIRDACGTGYKVIDKQAIRGATIYLTYSSGTGKNCVATMKTTSIGSKTRVSAFLEVKGGTRSTDSGAYGYFAGPVKKAAAGKCVKWGGSTSAASYTSPFEHCG